MDAPTWQFQTWPTIYVRAVSVILSRIEGGVAEERAVLRGGHRPLQYPLAGPPLPRSPRGRGSLLSLLAALPPGTAAAPGYPRLQGLRRSLRFVVACEW